MSKKVEVTYSIRDQEGDVIGVKTEINLLIEVDDEVTPIGIPNHAIDLLVLAQPGSYLLEDDFGLWYLKYEDCLEMKELK